MNRVKIVFALVAVFVILAAPAYAAHGGSEAADGSESDRNSPGNAKYITARFGDLPEQEGGA